MLYVRKPTTEEMQELEWMKRHAVGRVSQRAHMVLLSFGHLHESDRYFLIPT
jgi:hypothetical protein